MAFFRSSLSAALLSVSLVACGGSGGGGTVTPEGMHYHYVANKVNVPTSGASTSTATAPSITSSARCSARFPA
jgi:hypothetical protein